MRTYIESCIYAALAESLVKDFFARRLDPSSPKGNLPAKPADECWRKTAYYQPKPMAEKPPVVLTIAGFDPSSGAGVTADIKTIAAHACYGVACITAMTVQSTSGVRRVLPLDSGLVTETLDELEADLDITAVHIGMLGSGKVAKAVADFLASSGRRKKRLRNVVLDPILKSSSGADLLDAAGSRVLTERLIPLSDV